MDKLGIEYFCFHDRDIAPEGKNLAEFQKNLDCIVPLIKEQMQTYGIKLLWGTANCFASPKYMARRRYLLFGGGVRLCGGAS